jgi:small acid-soluble spore protein A (major alpha-type SASP)
MCLNTSKKGGMVVANRNESLVTGARNALDQLKLETANELGLQNYNALDKGMLPSRVNGSVGGYMVKKLVALAEQTLANHNQP